MRFLKRWFGGSSDRSTASDRVMDEDAFWAIIAQAAKGTPDPQERAVRLESILSSCSPEQLIAFDEFYSTRVEEAYTWDLWGAAFVIRGGCGDDGFEYFTNWLISQGREVYERALLDPQSLADLPHILDAQNESFGYAALTAYEEKTGEELPSNFRCARSEPAGKPWEEDEVDQLFPRLAKKYG